MTREQEGLVSLCFAVLALVGFVFLSIGLVVGQKSAEADMRKWQMEQRLGHYQCDPVTGKTTFVVITKEKQP